MIDNYIRINPLIVVMVKTFKFKLYRNERKQRKLLELVFIANDIFNHCIALSKRHKKLYGSFVYKNQMQKHLAKIIKRYKPEWKVLGSQAVQNITERIQLGVEKAARGENKRYPTFRKKRNAKSFLYKGSVGYKIEGNRITINSIKTTIGFHQSRPIEGKVKTVTIKRDALGDFFVFLSCDVSGASRPVKKSKPMTGKSAGFDFGLRTFLTSSHDSDDEINPEFLKRELKKVQKADRKLSRKLKGSSNRRKARENKARVHKRINGLRENYHWELANKLLDRYDSLYFEDLNIRGMQKLWGRKVSDLGFYAFMLKLKHLAKVHGKKVHLVDRYYPSSKTCSCCGKIKKDLHLKERFWKCGSCSTFHDRDKNAAINIHIEGTSSILREPVRPASKNAGKARL